jgi:hypothetical protein
MMDPEVEDFLDRHADAIATHLLYLRVQEALAKQQKRKAMLPIIDSVDLIGRSRDYPGMGAKIKKLQALATKFNVTFITATQHERRG